MGADCCKNLSFLGGGGANGKKRGRRNSGVFLIDERPILDWEEALKNNAKKDDTNKAAEGENDRSSDVAGFLRNCLLRSGIFCDEVSFRQLTPDDVNRIVNSFRPRNFETGAYLFHKGDYPCDYIYIAKRGLFRGMNGRVVKAIMKEGDLMGEIGFFHEAPRLLSIMADNKGGCATYALHKHDFKAVAEKGRDLNNIRLLNGLTIEQKYKLKDTKVLLNFRGGQYIFREGDQITDFYLVLSGVVQVYDPSLSASDVELKEYGGAEMDDDDDGLSGDDSGKDVIPDETPGPAAPPIDGVESGGSDGGDRGGGGSAAEEEKSVKAASVKASRVEDYAVIPGGHIGAESLILGRTTTTRHYLAMKETTILKIDKKLFDSEVFATVRPLLEQEIAMRERAQQEQQTKHNATKTEGKGSKPKRPREFDELEDDDADAAAAADEAAANASFLPDLSFLNPLALISGGPSSGAS